MSSRRHQAREVVLQMLFQKDLNPDVSPDTIREQIQEMLDNNEQLCRFAWNLFAGTMESLKFLDQKIELVAANWTVNRMPPTDRNTIRLGAFELLFTETPYPVVIDEALELAKSFGSAQSASFVNGILDKLVPAAKRSSPVPREKPLDDAGP
jgi:N utilization substance protein B